MPRPTIVLARLTRHMDHLTQGEDGAGQGRHIDPDEPGTQPPQTRRWSAAQQHASQSAAMQAFTDGLRPPGGGPVREGVIGDLAEYHGLDEAQVVEACRDWEARSVAEWQAARRDSAAGVTDFYETVESWSFDLLWYAYLQSAGYGYPSSVIVADSLSTGGGGRMLDLGSGVGATTQMFAALGWEVTLADVSSTLLEFARWRHQRRGMTASYVHLPDDLPDAAFDLVTALDVVAHIPDVADTARRLRRTLRPGGLLVANFDVRPPSAANAWHLYDDELPLRWAIQRAGFTPVQLIDGVLWVYRAVPVAGAPARLRTALAWIRLASPPARGLRRCRRLLGRAARRARDWVQPPPGRG